MAPDQISLLSGLPEPLRPWLEWVIAWWKELLALGFSLALLNALIWKAWRWLHFAASYYLVKPLSARFHRASTEFYVLVSKIDGDTGGRSNIDITDSMARVASGLAPVPVPLRLIRPRKGVAAIETHKIDMKALRWAVRLRADLLIWGYQSANSSTMWLRLITPYGPLPSPDKWWNWTFQTRKQRGSDAPSKDAEGDEEAGRGATDALHLMALTALEPSGASSAETLPLSRAERRRALLLEAGRKTEVLLAHSGGFSQQQRAEIAAAFAEALFLVVEETGDVRLPMRVRAVLGPVLEHPGKIDDGTLARLRLLQARALLGDHADNARATTSESELAEAHRLIRLCVPVWRRNGDRLRRFETAFWRIECLARLRHIGAIRRLLERVARLIAIEDDAMLWAQLTALRAHDIAYERGGTGTFLERLVEQLDEALRCLRMQAQYEIRLGGHFHAARAWLEENRLRTMVELGRRQADTDTLSDVIRTAEQVLNKLPCDRWVHLYQRITEHAVLALIYRGTFYTLSEGDMSNNRAAANWCFQQAESLAEKALKKSDGAATPRSGIVLEMYAAESIVRRVRLDPHQTSISDLAKATGRLELALKQSVDSQLLRHELVPLRERLADALLLLDFLGFGRNGQPSDQPRALDRVLELVEAAQSIALENQTWGDWARLEIRRGFAHLQRAESAADASAEYRRAERAFINAVQRFLRAGDPAGAADARRWVHRTRDRAALAHTAEHTRVQSIPN